MLTLVTPDPDRLVLGGGTVNVDAASDAPYASFKANTAGRE
jgi:hypothetical protein